MSTGLDTPPEAADVDPRMRARRVAVLREEGRRRRHRLTRLGALAVLLILALASARTPLLDVDRIRVEGAVHTTEQEVVGALGVERGDPMVDVDESEAARQVEALPWVAEAAVRRSWPGTVTVMIEEREAVAVTAAEGGGWAVLDSAGRVLAVLADRPSELVELSGTDAGEPGTRVAGRAEEALLVARLLPGALVAAVASVRVGDGAVVELSLHDGGTVLLGDTGALPAKLVAAATVVVEVGGSCVDVLDVRVPEVPALTRRPECA